MRRGFESLYSEAGGEKRKNFFHRAIFYGRESFRQMKAKQGDEKKGREGTYLAKNSL
jgi:hypothetical protein